MTDIQGLLGDEHAGALGGDHVRLTSNGQLGCWVAALGADIGRYAFQRHDCKSNGFFGDPAPRTVR